MSGTWAAVGVVTALCAAFAAVGWERQPAGVAKVLVDDALLVTPVGGLEATLSTAEIVDVAGPGFSKALRVTIGQSSVETNATQLTALNAEPIRAGDILFVSFWVRGKSASGRPARIEFLFEKSTSPWTKSFSQSATAGTDGGWKQFMGAFASAGDYAPGQAMASFRMAFGAQTVELAGLSLVNYRKSKSLDELIATAMGSTPLGAVTATVQTGRPKQTMLGFGGNFCQPRYGSTEPMDKVGEYVLNNLNVVHARIGLPLEKWNPEPGVFRHDAQTRASLLALQMMHRRRIPTVVSVWEGPGWMLGGQPEQQGRTLPLDRYDECVDAITRYLLLAKKEYGVEVGYFSFNEPDYGVNFKFTPAQMASFVRLTGASFAKAGLKTKFLTADTANGANLADYALPLLEDKSLAPYLGPIAFHSWDALGASDEAYEKIAELGKRFNKPVWCLEAGHDAQLWQAKDPWGTWSNAFRLAMAYERTIRLSGATLMDYWTYQDNYTLINPQTLKPHPAFTVMKQMEQVFLSKSRVVPVQTNSEELRAIGTVGPKPGQFGVLLVNPIGEGSVKLKGLPKNAKVTLTINNGVIVNRKTQVRTNSGGELSIELPVQSVVTVQ
jgi:O-glycosyl hydrolase